MEAYCPQCSQPMSWVNGHFHCDACNSDYQRLASCPDCGQPLQTLQACGAVDYFCQHGHGLISKQRVRFSYIPQV
ncbi:zinc ribbon domain-containing protein [Serratia sp. AKBS12]|uniref:zinc ribbon domain-containing protein n=1 Tax=Serratia sp. AKBS12 TaxID=2974597 RepID=UPI0021652C53|nr:zinc ribbon domain-containing protein [Serratia sp. AKBS12]MCS3407561.1 zinc ribbon domain-containing protein [Serratia sp. AKBS12]HEI8867610.1 zinc ribbon domain-containing protein [Serratia odorifera]